MRRLQIERIGDELLAELRYLNAVSGGGTEIERLPISRGNLAQPLGGELDAIIACSDLQGVVRAGDGTTQLLGIAVAAAVQQLAVDGILPPGARTGVVLAGDLYSAPDASRRGGHGDVSAVWRAFAEHHAWVAGVAGNHDDVSKLGGLERVHLLDGDVLELGGVRIGGVGLISGSRAKPGRRTEADQLARIARVIDQAPDLLVLHEGPHGKSPHQRGHAGIHGLVEAGEIGLTVCGHDHWRIPLSAHAAGQILNVDARVVVLVGRATVG
ncbi:MAG: hypothetical protein M3680_31980 [Myxococcota bacterium]|nr:hypothetical protein [Myxococcota bacterium]